MSDSVTAVNALPADDSAAPVTVFKAALPDPAAGELVRAYTDSLEPAIRGACPDVAISYDFGIGGIVLAFPKDATKEQQAAAVKIASDFELDDSEIRRQLERPPESDYVRALFEDRMGRPEKLKALLDLEASLEAKYPGKG